MRIISSFRDYYDGVSRYDQDHKTVYLRETKVLSKSNERYYWFDEFAVLGFCGELYPLVAQKEYGCKNLYSTYYTADEFVATNEGVHYRRDNYSIQIINEKFSGNYAALRGLFSKHNTPVFIYYIYTGKLISNPQLRPLHFYRIKSVGEAYQELNSYVGGVLNQNTKPVPAISDEVMRDIKGFDKYSFRKGPAPSKPR